MQGQLKIMEDRRIILKGKQFCRFSCYREMSFDQFLSLIFLIVRPMVNSSGKNPNCHYLSHIAYDPYFVLLSGRAPPVSVAYPVAMDFQVKRYKSSSRNKREFEQTISDSILCRFPQRLFFRVLQVNAVAQVLLAPVDPQENVDRMEAQVFLEWE